MKEGVLMRILLFILSMAVSAGGWAISPINAINVKQRLHFAIDSGNMAVVLKKMLTLNPELLSEPSLREKVISLGLQELTNANAQRSLGVVKDFSYLNDRIKSLLEDRLADVDYRATLHIDVSGELHKAVSAMDLPILKLVLKNCSDINMVMVGRSPLMTAYLSEPSHSEYVSVTRFLIKKGADVNFLDTMGKTPLHYALIHGNRKAIQLLLDSGADIDRGMTARVFRMSAKSYGISQTKLLQELPPTVRPLDIAIAKKDTELIALLLRNGAKGTLYPDGYRARK